MKLINKIYQISIPVIISIMLISFYIQYIELQKRVKEEKTQVINFNIEKALNLSHNSLFLSYFDHIEYALQEEAILNKESIKTLFQSQFKINESYGKHLSQISFLDNESKTIVFVSKDEKVDSNINFNLEPKCDEKGCEKILSVLTEKFHIVKLLLSDEKDDIVKKYNIKGQLVLIYSTNNSNIKSLQENLTYQMILYNLILLAFLIGLIYVFVKMVVDPIKKLSEKIENKDHLFKENLGTDIKEIKYLEKSFLDFFKKNLNQHQEIQKLNKVQAELLRTSNKKLYGLYQLSPLGIALCDIDGNFLEFNKAFERICGYTDKELKELCAWELTPKKYHDDELKQYKILKETGFYGPYEKEYKQKDGTFIPINLNGMIIKNENGEELVWSIVEDITQRKETEKTLFNQAKLVSMGEMIANIAHQWRQPLSIISTGATGMKMKKEFDVLSDEELYKYCDTINTNAQYLSNTIDDFRNFIKDDKIKKKFTITDTINSFLHLVEGDIKNNSINIIIDLDDEIIINGNKNELIQCFINLFHNSKDAYSKSSKEKFIFIKSYTKDKKLFIEFKDNAGGIDKEVLPHIFDPYYTTKHQSQGTGLGLSILFNFITITMNGTIEASNIFFEYNNQNFKGTKFEIILPIV